MAEIYGLRFFFVRPEIKLEIYRTTSDHWGMFKDHHYLDEKINKAFDKSKSIPLKYLS